MKKMLLLLTACFMWLSVQAQGLGDSNQDTASTCIVPADSSEHVVLFETDMGSFKVKLYNDTPKHRDNFLRLVRDKFYEGVLFHRVIPGFMVQTGDSASRYAQPGQQLGFTNESYRIPAEIRTPKRFHKIGALAAARENDRVNPEKASSPYQFYIVTGHPYTDDVLMQIQEYLSQMYGHPVKFTEEQLNIYRQAGGAPHLDGGYTVFGEVTEGLETINTIQCVKRDSFDRPLEDIHIIRAVQIQ